MKQKIYIFRLVCFALCGLVLLISKQTFAQEEISLEQAVDSQLVTIQIIGRDVAFIQPMLRIRLENQSDSPLTIKVSQGLILDSTGESYGDMIVSKEESVSMAPLQSSESIIVELYAYSLDFNKSFPSEKIQYTVDRITNDDQLLALLQRITAANGESELSGQLAVWMLVGDIGNFDELDNQIEQSLSVYRQQTEFFLYSPTQRPAWLDFLQGFFFTLLTVLPLLFVALYIRSRFLGSSPYLLGTYPYMIKGDQSAIGAGGYIWKAQHVWKKKVVALKFPISINGVFVELFGPGEKNDELQDDDNIILSMESRRKFHEKNKENRLYIILDRIEGCSLSDLQLKKDSPFPLSIALEIIDQILGALKYIHDDEQGVIEYRAVEPNNILLDKEGNVYLAYFGSTKEKAQNPDLVEKKNVDLYLAPEARGQISGAGKPADVYSVGVLMYELLTGKLPFTDQSTTRRFARHFEMEIKQELLRELILKCLKQKPEERYENLDEMRMALDQHPHHQAELAQLVQEYCEAHPEGWWQVWLS
ncbi:MAG: serine/threonine protein kinase [Ardenticatenaceae bacterium]